MGEPPAADGAAGIVRVLELIETEMRIALGLLGVTALDQLKPSHLHPAEPVRPHHALSGFPFLRFQDPEY